jgi:hypothetical protein
MSAREASPSAPATGSSTMPAASGADAAPDLGAKETGTGAAAAAHDEKPLRSDADDDTKPAAGPSADSDTEAPPPPPTPLPDELPRELNPHFWPRRRKWPYIALLSFFDGIV